MYDTLRHIQSINIWFFYLFKVLEAYSTGQGNTISPSLFTNLCSLKFPDSIRISPKFGKTNPIYSRIFIFVILLTNTQTKRTKHKLLIGKSNIYRPI